MAKVSKEIGRKIVKMAKNKIQRLIGNEFELKKLHRSNPVDISRHCGRSPKQQDSTETYKDNKS